MVLFLLVCLVVCVLWVLFGFIRVGVMVVVVCVVGWVMFLLLGCVEYCVVCFPRLGIVGVEGWVCEWVQVSLVDVEIISRQ